MKLTFLILSIFLALISFLPSFNISHWTFRIVDFIRLQLLFLQVLLLIIGVTFIDNDFYSTLSEIALSISILFQATIIYPYLPFKSNKATNKKNAISLVSVNVLQKNNNYEKLISLVEQVKPDILLTMETNSEWEKGIKKLEYSYSYNFKIPKENRYGMHFYTNLEVTKIQEHYLISNETPSIEVYLKDETGNDFIFWGVHPPPPSPTEKPTAKQKDAELMKVAKRIRKTNLPTIISGDFNNVCWSRSSSLFSKTSGLLDARKGRGVYGTFPSSPWFMRFPLDLVFNSREIEVNLIKTLKTIGSDHLPLFSQFTINKATSNSKHIQPELESKVNSIIKEGKAAVKTE